MTVQATNERRIRDLEKRVNDLESELRNRRQNNPGGDLQVAIVETTDPPTGSYPTTGTIVPVRFHWSSEFTASGSTPTFTGRAAKGQTLAAPFWGGSLPAKDTKWLAVKIFQRWILVSRIRGHKATLIRFNLNAALATSDASQASCNVEEHYNGDDPGSTVTVQNPPVNTASTYLFEGDSGDHGWAFWDEENDEYIIFQMEC